MRRIVNKNVYNMRDLGGYQTYDNKVTKEWRFIRSDLPYSMSKNEMDVLINHNIRTVIDLRNLDEVLEHPDCLNNENFDYYQINLNGAGIPSNEEDIAPGYLAIIDDYDKMSQVFKVMIDAEGGVLYHCSGGKDRTGVVSVLLLLLAGCNDLDIKADYIVSYNYLRPKLANMDLSKYPRYAGQSKLEYIDEFLKLFYDKYININNYMKKLDLTSEEIAILYNKLVN